MFLIYFRADAKLKQQHSGLCRNDLTQQMPKRSKNSQEPISTFINL
jgi:hypothetical protein